MVHLMHNVSADKRNSMHPLAMQDSQAHCCNLQQQQRSHAAMGCFAGAYA
jgi:hypothetical protein